MVYAHSDDWIHLVPLTFSFKLKMFISMPKYFRKLSSSSSDKDLRSANEESPLPDNQRKR